MIKINPNFCTKYFDADEPSSEKLLKVWYYAITTLSTIGYGDMFPISPEEQLCICFILLIGVGVFSFVMGQFFEILLSHNELGSVGDHKELTKWIALLARFNNN